MPRDRRETHALRGKVDARVAEMAARQWGVVNLAELRACGLTSAIEMRVEAGRLFRVHRGVYAVGIPRLSLNGRFLAAVMACGEGAVLSHYSAAVLWGLRTWIEHLPDVTGPDLRTRAGINVHRSSNIESTVHLGIPVVTPAPALFDIAPTVPPWSLRGAVNEALNLRLIEPVDLIRHHGRGAAQLRAVLATAAPTKSENENLVLHLLDEAGIRKPLVNPTIAGTRLIPDFLWPAHKLGRDHYPSRPDGRPGSQEPPREGTGRYRALSRW
ncbi:type IV toxin-antitoxin system AbiEi family antitoxin domain-containing protein [Solirubrobacter taibaiensis]|nr:type IV toxin-antitoxin system AbiEi family antitoxin domain-containing protein [Solirubrobacter taibaiensis]